VTIYSRRPSGGAVLWLPNRRAPMTRINYSERRERERERERYECRCLQRKVHGSSSINEASESMAACCMMLMLRGHAKVQRVVVVE
jgi:hypothetical protein